MRSAPSKTSFRTSEAGLTLIECLVAIAVIAATIGTIAPVTVLAVATRVQNQRAEQAIHIARSEIDKIRLVVERGGAYNLDNVASTSGTLAAVPAPENIASSPITVNNARSVPGNEAFAVQVFRTHTANGLVNGQPIAFELGVRVYKARSIETLSASQLGTQQASLAMTSGEGQATSRPLAVIYTTIVKSDSQQSLCDYYRYVDSTASAPGACPSP